MRESREEAADAVERGDERERACTWWHVERRGSWEGPAHQTAAIHLAHSVLLSPTLFSRLHIRYPTLFLTSLSPRVLPCLTALPRALVVAVSALPRARGSVMRPVGTLESPDGKTFGAKDLYLISIYI